MAFRLEFKAITLPFMSVKYTRWMMGNVLKMVTPVTPAGMDPTEVLADQSQVLSGTPVNTSRAWMERPMPSAAVMAPVAR